VWIDDDGAGSFDPGVVGFVIENLVALAGPLVAYLALRAKNGRVEIPVEDEKRQLILTVHPDVTDEDMTALTELLSEYGKLGGPAKPEEKP
jgi:hypothetical protein